MQEIRLSNKTNKLELDPYSYQLQDVESPELFREMFPYTETPKIAFNYRRVPENMPEDIFITDTTFRDGQQSRAPYTMEQMVHIYKLLHELGGPNGMIRQTEFFVYSEKDRKALEKCMESRICSVDFPETYLMYSENDDLRFHTIELDKKMNDIGVAHVTRAFGAGHPESGHVFHLNLRNSDGVQCNEEECSFFKNK